MGFRRPVRLIDVDARSQAATAQALALAASNAAAQAIADAADAQASADGKVTTYFQITEPTGLVAGTAGDLWFDTDDGNRLYRWSGSAWTPSDDTRISAAVTAAGNAQTTANSKITTLYQTTAPGSTGRTNGDLWVDTDDGNRLYRWNANTSAWVDVAPFRIDTGRGGPAGVSVRDASVGQVQRHLVEWRTDVTGAGTAAAELTAVADDNPATPETVLSTSFHIGGSAANSAGPAQLWLDTGPKSGGGYEAVATVLADRTVLGSTGGRVELQGWTPGGLTDRTSTQRLALVTSTLPFGTEVRETDTGKVLWWDGAAWRLRKPEDSLQTGGANAGWSSTAMLWVAGLGGKVTVPADSVRRAWACTITSNVVGTGWWRLRCDLAAGNGKAAASLFFPAPASPGGLRVVTGGNEVAASFQAGGDLLGDQAATLYLEARAEVAGGVSWYTPTQLYRFS